MFFNFFIAGLYSFMKTDFLAPQLAQTDFYDINVSIIGFAGIDLLSFLFCILNSTYLFFNIRFKRLSSRFLVVNFTTHFCDLKNEFNYFLLLCFCFKNLDLLDGQTIQFDFSLSALFVIIIFFGLKLWIKSLHPKQYVVLVVFHFLSVLFLIVCFSFFVIWWNVFGISLAYFDFVIAIIFSKSFAILLITSFTAFFCVTLWHKNLFCQKIY